jgi:hypothetical protein
MKMYRGKASVDVHPSQIQTMLNRGWSITAPAAKPKKVTTKEANHG